MAHREETERTRRLAQSFRFPERSACEGVRWAMQQPKYFRDKADEVRSLADTLKTEDAGCALPQVAAQYDYLREVTEREERRAVTVSSARAAMPR